MKQTNPEEWSVLSAVGRDIHRGVFVEAVCAHGIGHHLGVHGCDGCCETMPEEIKNKVTKE
jgi:hypothetical protein